jgi:HK97 family phage portal protein
LGWFSSKKEIEKLKRDLHELKEKQEARNVLTDPNSWLARQMGGMVTNAGTHINNDNVYGLSAVYCCIRLLAWTIANLPLHTFKKLPKGQEKAYDNPLYGLLHDSPNPEQSAFEFESLMTVNQMGWGAGVAEIERDPITRRPIALWPIPTYCVTPRRTPGQKLLIYEVNAGGTIYKPYQRLDGISEYIWPEDLIIFPALTSTRDEWRSPVTTHRETFGYAMALKEFGSKTFGQGVNPAGIISVENPLSETAEANLIKALEGYTGLARSNRLMYLNAGVKFERIGLPLQDAQFIENQRMQIAEAARIFCIPLFLLNETEKSTTWGSGLEELNSSFVTYSLSPLLVQREQELTKKLFRTTDISGKVTTDFFPKYNVDALLRGKLLDRYMAYSVGRQNTFLSPDDCREKEDMNPLPNGEGERYDTPLNLANVDIADKIAQMKSQKPEPAKPGEKPKPNEGTPKGK